MTFPERTLSLLLIMLAAFSPGLHAENNAGDVVTTVNGNIHVGQVRLDAYPVKTAYGSLIIPASHMRRLQLQAGGAVQISTIREEHISGTLEPVEISMSRLQGPPLPLALSDISVIQFGDPTGEASAPDLPSRLETNSGDQLMVSTRFTELPLLTEGEEQRYPANGLRYVDSSLHSFEDERLTQLHLRDHSRAQGTLMEETLALSSPYLETLNLPIEHLSRLILDVTLETTPLNVFSHPMRALGEGPQMVALLGGIYLRGDHQGDGDDDEHPLAEIKLKPFAIGRYEISFEEYDLFCQRTPGCRPPDDQDWGRGARPVINVSWHEAQAYVDWLAEKTGHAYRLPSDAEWEFAHRAGTTSRYPWGNESGQARANCEGCNSIWDGDKTSPVGRFEANAYGLFDTAGNVFEWVADCFHDRFADAPSDGTPIEKEGCGKRVIRGGAWSFPPHEIRAANRWRDFPSRRSDDTGFRVAVDLE